MHTLLVIVLGGVSITFRSYWITTSVANDSRGIVTVSVPLTILRTYVPIHVTSVFKKYTDTLSATVSVIVKL